MTLFPCFVLTGTAGRQATQLHDLTLGLGNFFSVGPGISLPLFTGGRIRSNIAVQTSRQCAALINYQATILNSLEEVQNALVNYSQEQERRDRLNQAVEQSQLAVDLATEQYRAGLVDFLSVLEAQGGLYANEDQLVESDKRYYRPRWAVSRAGWRLECRECYHDEQTDALNFFHIPVGYPDLPMTWVPDIPTRRKH